MSRSFIKYSFKVLSTIVPEIAKRRASQDRMQFYVCDLDLKITSPDRDGGNYNVRSISAIMPNIN